MDIKLINRLRSFITALHPESVSIGYGSRWVVLSCIPTHLDIFEDITVLVDDIFPQEYTVASELESVTLLWAGPQGINSIQCLRNMPFWTPNEFIPGVYAPICSLILRGDFISVSTCAYALDVKNSYLNCYLVDQELRFETESAKGIIAHSDTVENLMLVNRDTVTTLRQDCHLVMFVDNSLSSLDPLQFHQDITATLRSRFLKTDKDFSPEELQTSVDLEILKTVAKHPQDLAALLGMGLKLKPELERIDLEWKVDRYLLNPIVLSGYDATACIEAGLPFAPEGLAPDWAPHYTPEIPEPLPKKLLRNASDLSVYLVDEIQVGELWLPYLLVQPGCKINAGNVEQSPKRPLLLFARNGRKAFSIVGDLVKRTLFLRAMVRMFTERAEMERHQIIVQRYPFQMDPILAALWLVSQAQNLSRGEASSLGHLRRSALGVSIALRNEIEALRKKKPVKDTDLALLMAVEALDAKRLKLINRLEKSAQIGAT